MPPIWECIGDSDGERPDSAAIVLAVIKILVFAGARMFYPVRIALVPFHGFLDSFFEANGRSPTQFTPNLGAMECIATIMSGTILHKLDERLGLAEIPQDGAHDFEIGLRRTRGNVVNTYGCLLVKHQADRFAIVLHKEPVTFLHAVTVDGNG